MTKDEKLVELNLTMYCENNEKDKMSSISKNLSTVNEVFSYKWSNPWTKFNFALGFTSECFEKIVQHNNLYQVRENTQKC